MKLKLVSLTGNKLEKEVYEVIMPTESGEISVFPSHEDLVTLVKPGALSIRYKKEDDDDFLDFYAVAGGIAIISNDEIKLLVDNAIYSANIIADKEQAALEKAIELQKNATNEMDQEKAIEIINRQKIRLHVAELRRQHQKRNY